MDTQEEQLKAGRFPDDGKGSVPKEIPETIDVTTLPFGVDNPKNVGELYEGATGKCTKIESYIGTYMDFYRKVYSALSNSSSDKDKAEAAGLVSAKRGSLIVYILELAKKSHDEGRTLPVEWKI